MSHRVIMRRVLTLSLVCICLLHAAIFGRVQGIVHDPQHRPIAGASITLRATTSDFSQSTRSDNNGEFSFVNVPIGDYNITVTQAGFAPSQQSVTVESGSSPVLHFPLAIAALSQTATVSGAPSAVNMDSVTPTTLINREDIAQTPGADRTNSMGMITDYTPGAYVTHDMLHMRGGHQVDWLIDGIPIPNTNIAANLGPQIDPKTSTTSKCSAAATTPNMAIAPTAFSTSCLAPDSSATIRASW